MDPNTSINQKSSVDYEEISQILAAHQDDEESREIFLVKDGLKITL